MRRARSIRLADEATHGETNSGRLHDLLADRVTQVLSPVESDELADLLVRHPDVSSTTYDRVAAALDVSFVKRHFEPLPTAVREKLEAGAIAWRAK
jgi:hypothetical protein